MEGEELRDYLMSERLVRKWTMSEMDILGALPDDVIEGVDIDGSECDEKPKDYLK